MGAQLLRLRVIHRRGLWAVLGASLPSGWLLRSMRWGMGCRFGDADGASNSSEPLDLGIR